MEELEKHLRALCRDDARLRLLEAQWEYDKRLVQQALQSVGNTFPHYSLHDASHSNSILVNISRILGPRLALLSATDTWLLLETSYWHDIGMVVGDKALRSWWSTAEFVRHLADLEHSSDSMLAAAARLLRQQPPAAQVAKDWPLDVRQAIIFVAADFARKRHPTRAAEAIRHPAGYNIDSPRALIPARLFEWLARVCAAHGSGRAEVYDLPYAENGIGTDLCHPRFVAFMLRLGDLLDLDNGRFCPILLGNIGRLPHTSVDHVGKHASVTRFFVSPEKIDVEAVCYESHDAVGNVDSQVYRTYHAVSEWLRWLEDELTFLAIRWSSIAPEAIPAAPSIGTIRAELSGYELLPSKGSADFDIDRDYFLDLSKSSGLFGSPEKAWQRELITNAVDATLLRVWQDLSEVEQAGIVAAIDPIREFERHTSRHPIRIDISPDENAPDGHRNWRIEIADEGCGIGIDDVHSMQVIGSSRRNRTRSLATRRIPESLRPTGSFGLGFQSVFLDTEEVHIDTHHAATRSTRKMLLARPNRKVGHPSLEVADDRSGVYVRKTPDGDIPRRPGTAISFYVKRTPQFGILRTDPVVADLRPTAAAWINEIQQLCASLPVPVIVNGAPAIRNDDRSSFSFFAPEQSMRITFTSDNHENGRLTVTAYRGCEVSRSQGTENLLNIRADLFAGRASDFLQVNRTEFTANGAAEFERRKGAALVNALQHYLQHLRSGGADGAEDELGRASLSALGVKGVSGAGDEWKSLRLAERLGTNGPVQATLGDLFESRTCRIIVGNAFFPGSGGETTIPLDLPAFTISATGQSIVLKLIRKEFKHICYETVVGPLMSGGFPMLANVYRMSKSEEPGATLVDDRAFKFALFSAFGGRPTLPVPERYRALVLPDTYLGWARQPAMLAPYHIDMNPFSQKFEVTIHNVDAYVNFVSAKPYPDQKLRTRTDVVAAASDLLVEADAEFAKHSKGRRSYDLGATLSRLKSLAT